jgi:hypothetical protein
MKQQLLSLFAISIVPAISFAQVSFTAANAPVNNTMFTYHDANEPNPPFVFSKSGTTNTWDFTNVPAVTGADDTTYVRIPSQVNGYTNFPGATHAMWEVGDNAQRFVKIDASGAYMLGLYGDVFDIGTDVALVLLAPVKVYSFPVQYGSMNNSNPLIEYKVSGASVGQPAIDSLWYKSIHNDSKEIIAEGNMVVPMGTFPALLEVSRENIIDSLFIKSSASAGQWILAPGFPKVTNDSTFYWYGNQYLQQYAHVIYKNGLVTDVNYIKSVTVSPVSSTPKIVANTVSLYPNPAQSTLHFNNSNEIEQLLIRDVTGATLLTHTGNCAEIDIQQLAKGIYFIEVNQYNNRSQTLKFVKL